MVHKYKITGMTCVSCEAKVKSDLLINKNVSNVEVSKARNLATITMKKHIPIAELQEVLAPKYQIKPIESCETNTYSEKSVADNSYNWSDVSIWKKSAFNTLNCLIGCSIGDFSMIIFLQYYYPETAMATQMILAIIAGLLTSIALETAILHYRENLIWTAAFKMAIGMSFLSMIGMEIAMNTTDFMITGGKLDLSNPNYWLAFIPAAIVGFLVPLPYNYYKLKKYNKACH